MNATGTTRAISWFGKLPCVGDFCSLNMPEPLRSALDDWLSGALLAGQSKYAERWAQAYFDAPMHGFVWGQNTLHTLPAERVVGVIMPSVDKAGRAFPFILMEQLPAQRTQPLGLQSLKNWFLHAHGLCANALNEEWSLDQLKIAVATLPKLEWAHTDSQPIPVAPGIGQWFQIDFTGHIHHVLECAGLPQGPVFDALLGLQQPNLP